LCKQSQKNKNIVPKFSICIVLLRNHKIATTGKRSSITNLQYKHHEIRTRTEEDFDPGAVVARGFSSGSRPPVPPFSYDDAVVKVRMAENAWNTRDPLKVSLAYTEDTVWRNRSQFVTGRDQVREFLSTKWQREQEYRLIKEIWCHSTDRIAVRFCYEYHDSEGKWFRAYGNENWHFAENGLMKNRHASINDVPISESERLFHWDTSGPRPEDHPGLTELGL
jgi:uncharacterized protein